MKQRQQINRGFISLWSVLGFSLILVAVVLTLAWMNYNREKQYMGRVLSEKGAALIKSFEAGARTGMMGMLGTGPNLQTLLRETASLPDILYIAIVAPSGVILAHNNQKNIGQLFMSPQALAALNASNKTQWRMAQQKNGPEAFEAYKLFIPIRPAKRAFRMGMRSHHKNSMHSNQQSTTSDEYTMRCRRNWMRGLEQKRLLDPNKRPVILIGMDATPFNEAIAKDIRQTLLISGVLLLLGLAGVVSLFWAQSYARSRKLLQDTRALAGEIVSTMPEGIVVCGPDGSISFINAIAENMLGLREADNTEKMAAELLPPELWELRTQISKGQLVVEQEVEFHNNGLVLPATAAVTEIRTDDGDYVGLLFLLRDLSQLRQLQEEIRKKDKMAAIGRLAAGVAHEVRNPLSSIKGYATYFGSLFPADSDNRKAAQVMTSEVDRLNRVISELLEMTRPADIKLSNVNIADLLENSLRLVKQEADAAHVRVATHIDQGLETVQVDPDRLTQALINLYINAIQAMPQGGTLGIQARLKQDKLHVSISDTGHGLPPEAQKRIFDPYFTTKTTGTGLGLAIVQKIIEAHGGTIAIEHSGPEGTRFVLHLPLANQKDASA